MLTALSELAKKGPRPAETEIIFVGLVDEEHAQAGSRGLVASGLRADLAIVGEATRLQVVTAHKGTLWMKLETRGKAAHGSCPELGRNAVHAMARVVDLLQTAYAAQLRRHKHPLLGCATVSVGAIHGGTQPNIVPDQCSILLDRRILPGETEAGVRREINRLLRQKGLGVSYVYDNLPPCPPLETDAKRPLVARFLHSIGQRKPAGVRYFCDASVLGHGGIPSVVFGPGDIAQAHTVDEWISLEELERGERLLLRFLQSFS
jgi:acetylornithine deacetylase